jgi:hypothetical protein
MYLSDLVTQAMALFDGIDAWSKGLSGTLSYPAYVVANVVLHSNTESTFAGRPCLFFI